MPAVAGNEEPAAKNIFKMFSVQKMVHNAVWKYSSHLLDVGKLQLVVFQIWGEKVKAKPTMSIDCRSRVLKIYACC